MAWEGFKHNLSKDGVVRILPGSGLAMVESSVYQILNTAPGERVHLPEFGSRLKLLVFEPIDEFLAIQIKTEIKDAINRWEDRITVLDVDVLLPGENQSTDLESVTAIIRYIMLKGNRDVREFKITTQG